MRARLVGEGVDFISIIRGHIDSDDALSRVIPPMGTPSHRTWSSPGRSGGEVAGSGHARRRINDVATARHAIRDGLLDLVGMTRAQIADPHIVREDGGGRGGPDPALRRRQLSASTRSTSPATPSASTTPQPGASRRLPHTVAAGAGTATRGRGRRRTGGPGGRPGARRARPPGGRARGRRPPRRPGPAGRRRTRRRDLIGIVDWRVAEASTSASRSATGGYAEAARRPRRSTRRGRHRHRRPAQRRLPRPRAPIWSPTAGTCSAVRSGPRGTVLRLRRQRRGAGPGRRRAARLHAGADIELRDPRAHARPRRSGA